MVSEIIDEINSAVDADALFSTIKKRASNKYRRMMRAVHPDVDSSPEAAAAAARLNALWEDWRAKHDGKPTTTSFTPKAKPELVKILKTDSSAIFKTDDGWLSVDRRAGSEPLDADVISAIKKLESILGGSPVEAGGSVSVLKIPQADGLHDAVKIDRALMDDGWTLDKIGKVSGRDAAWILKRLVFLAGALETVGLEVPELGARVLVQPSKHMIGLFDFIGSARYDDTDAMTPLMRGFLECVVDENTDDGKRLAAFARGCMLRWSRPSPSGLMNELDEMLFDLYGKPEYHPMADPVGH